MVHAHTRACVNACEPSFNAPTYVTQRMHARGTARGLTLSRAIQLRPTGSPGPGSFFSFARCGSSYLPLLASLLPPFLSLLLRRPLSLFLPLSLRHGEVISAPVQVFIDTHVRRIGIWGPESLYALSLRAAWHVISLMSLPPL